MTGQKLDYEFRGNETMNLSVRVSYTLLSSQGTWTDKWLV